MTDPLTPDLDAIESKAKAALAFQPEPPSDGWPDDEPEKVPEWDATSGWLEDGGHAAFCRQHDYGDDQESDGADVDAAYIKALDPTTVLALVAECRELRRLRGALRVLQDAGLTYVDDTADYDLSEAGLLSLAADYKERLGT